MVESCNREEEVGQKNDKLGEKSWSAELWTQIIRSVTTEHNNTISRNGNAFIPRDNSKMHLPEWFYIILNDWVIFPIMWAANINNDAKIKKTKVYHSINHRVFGKSLPESLSLSVTADHWLNNSTVRDKSPVRASLGCSLGSWLYIQTSSTADHLSQG